MLPLPPGSFQIDLAYLAWTWSMEKKHATPQPCPRYISWSPRKIPRWGRSKQQRPCPRTSQSWCGVFVWHPGRLRHAAQWLRCWFKECHQLHHGCWDQGVQNLLEQRRSKAHKKQMITSADQDLSLRGSTAFGTHRSSGELEATRHPHNSHRQLQ